MPVLSDLPAFELDGAAAALGEGSPGCKGARSTSVSWA